MDSRVSGQWKKLQYLVAWDGYGPEENSWEPAKNFHNALDAVDEFHKTHPKALGKNDHQLFQRSKELDYKTYELNATKGRSNVTTTSFQLDVSIEGELKNQGGRDPKGSYLKVVRKDWIKY